MNYSEKNSSTKRGFYIEKSIQAFSNRLLIANRSTASIRSYTYVIRRLYEFHQSDLFKLEIDQIIDLLTFLKVNKELN